MSKKIKYTTMMSNTNLDRYLEEEDNEEEDDDSEEQ